DVFVRELLQNAVHAIRARTVLQPEHGGEIHMELVAGRGHKPATLVVTDNGIGLTDAEVHQFLATIGESSKTAQARDRPGEFLGQFGIGILSCFLVADEIVVISRSARGEAPAVEWRGRPDGTYSVKRLEADLTPGTQVYLTCKAGAAEWFETATLRERA